MTVLYACTGLKRNYFVCSVCLLCLNYMVKVTILIMSYKYVYTGLHIMCFCDKIDCFQMFTSQEIVYLKAA